MTFDRPITALSSLAVAIAMLSQAATAETTPAQTLAPVIITGEKIERTQAESTTAVTALSDEEVDNGQFESVMDLTSLVPNAIEGAEGVPNVRGVSGSGGTAGGVTLTSGAKPRISTSIDGMSDAYFGEGYNLDSLWDVEQVEFLRGPQSTLQGRSASAGAVVVKTKDPSFDWEAAVRAGYETADEETLLAGMVSGPLIEDQLAFRLSAQGSLADSYIDYKLDDGWPWDPAETTRTDVRAKLLWMPEFLPDFSSQLTFNQRTQEGEYMRRVTEPYDDYVLDGDLADINHRVTDSTSQALVWDMDYILSNDLTAYVTYTHGNVDSSFEMAGNGSSNIGMSMDVTEVSNTLDSRLVYDPSAGRLQAVVGTNFYQRTQDIVVVRGSGIDGDGSVLTGSVYGDSTFALTDSLNLIAGGRLEAENQKRDVSAYGNPLDSDVDTLVLLPKVGASYEFLPQNTVTATVRKGYTPGGGAVAFDGSYDYYEFDREEVITYELLSHLSMLEGGLVVDTALFYNDYSDFQNFSGGKIVNVESGRNFGAELSASLQATAGLSLTASMGVLSTEVTEASGAVADLEGNEFANAPAFNASLGAKQNWNSGVFLNGSANYVGEYYSDGTNNEDHKAGDYYVLNSAVGYENDDFTVRLYGRNLTNETVILSQSTRTVKEARVATPRTFGLTVDYRF
ncbi:hypothetical protein BGP77_10955 [Saccharospirillum sp. MSK14-1]|uniref:TonB-dependent receptor n=1 Tax=Saccharospirillum sp. MSK14-1 TaxID=1897632 RepID=UPI000D3535B0|nr:TonB-dependent receptor plug domain-containing protein [Saccharospirillum sp. MSK14-1]PTY38693.1 hypothetical protein BGP77_10955 [Saccharospirillum sp. MSK14-1]